MGAYYQTSLFKSGLSAVSSYPFVLGIKQVTLKRAWSDPTGIPSNFWYLRKTFFKKSNIYQGPQSNLIYLVNYLSDLLLLILYCPQSKQKSVNLYDTFSSFLWSIIVFIVGKTNVIIDTPRLAWSSSWS